MVYVFGVKIFIDKLLNCKRVDIIFRCGYVINLDRLGFKIKALLSFRGEYFKKGN